MDAYPRRLGSRPLSFSRHQSRTTSERCVRPGGRLVLQQSFDIIDQTGVDIQATKGAWLWKFEGISRWSGQADSHFLAAVGGFEYTTFDLFETGSDLGLLLEYLYDGRNSGAPQTAAQDDVFAGARVTLNDVQDTSALIGFVIDRHTGASVIAIEAERRIGDSFKLEIDGGVIVGAPTTDFILFGRRKDDFVQARLLYYF